MRHNKIRDLEAELMKEVCHDVRTEPELMPIDGNHYLSRTTTTTADGSRPDVVGTGVWGAYEKTFLDIISLTLIVHRM